MEGNKCLFGNQRYFRFGDAVFKSLATVEISLKTPAGIPIILMTLEILADDIPALLGLEMIDDESLLADKVTNRLVHRIIISKGDKPLRYVDLWSMPLDLHDNQVYA